MSNWSVWRSGGCIQVHGRDTNNGVPVLGDDLHVNEMHVNLVWTTEKEEINQMLRSEYLSRIWYIYTFLEREYPDYYADGIRMLSEGEKADKDQFHHRNARNLVYNDLNIKSIKAFLAPQKMNWIHSRKRQRNRQRLCY